MKKLPWALLVLSLAGCGEKTSPKSHDTLISNDFESLEGWVNDLNTTSLTREKAHSGQYSLKVDGTTEYGRTYTNQLGKMHDTRPKKLKINAWVFVSGAQAGAKLVTVITDPAPDAKPAVWDGLDVVAAVKSQYGKWVEISNELTVPESVTPTNKFQMYLWRTGGAAPVYLDDLTVTAAE
ncbi:hypothetical protein [Hymenobacter glacieicola]|uniref:CBM-cenC domain-containing protein n=1 Tax=Hymenobacter glacieicola TaxID=1562124 RepID=A0ABQ1WSZ9_9BACT|nr:hypothetical protein [Hymenobacter glacieicola]GGG44366.1 hypothetical protein GCM10011378_20900 [Hymenobacter glacieicola]